MKWEKKGLIFRPADYFPGEIYTGFAQSPQALVFDDYIRIYFSIRRKDKENMYLSEIMYVDFDKTFRQVLQVSDKPVITLGERGTFDEHGIFPFSPFRYQNRIMAYTCGWSRRMAVPVETSTGLVFSEDEGKTFFRTGTGPVLTSSIDEPFLVGDSFVKYYEERFHMWYIYGVRWLPATAGEPVARVYKIAHATSADGVAWEKEGRAVIEDSLNADECQALPAVIRFDGKYHMFFCYRYATGFRKDKNRGYRIGYAFSTDLVNWKRNDSEGGLHPGNSGEWDSDMLCYPNVFSTDDGIFILYNGNEFGKEGFGLAKLSGSHTPDENC